MAVLQWIDLHLHTPWLDALMLFVTQLGDAGAVWLVLAAVLLAYRPLRPLGKRVLLALLLSALCCNLALKPLIARPRPFAGLDMQLLLPAPTDPSFPSGHTCASFAAVAALRRGPKKLLIPAAVLACAIAFSRIYLFVHYPGDVLGGALIGAALGYAADWLCCRAEAQGKA